MALGFVVGGVKAGRSLRTGRTGVCARVWRRRTSRVSMSKESETLKIVQDETVNKFYMDDGENGRRELNMKEKEYLFLDALYAYGAADSSPLITDEQFDLLKDDLMWEGSQILLLNEKEKKFLEAARAYYRKEPVMGDEEFDALREELVLEGSKVAVSRGPKCSLETKICTTDTTPDSTRMFVTYLPAAGIGAILWAAVSFEIPYLKSVNDLYSLAIGFPFILLFAKVVTNAVLTSPSLILVGACPNCGEDIRAYFGAILNVGESPKDTSDVKCEHCRAPLTFRESTRKIEIDASRLTEQAA
mmetsp:Transcript_32682/g.128465  ORF Transcript_32682/g.128465 Transcript_32682/m.128465 type:complete len:302 (-) Transcript_32682:328-1233(-)|eukprot:CAMPEP_0113966252 /NCGR_PEP_ID=MMETSP0011_2-20120614/8227_1 /TAXON_ID=101924 /ORGANISM="Rhodosorus marinus" /LENGTH=301 /DNA_ID=CAMNT_0000978915 /DNA_START=45 /DNA_END=950 /DNA_ORIENTATION=- /assembly_acc=CAM_ASM_000156